MAAPLTFGEKYRVVRELGRGGMGVVYEAVHIQLGSHVALKRLAPEVVSPDTVQRFLREARAAANLRSPHVARVMDVGTTPAGVPWLVMELLEGEDLATLLAARGPLPVSEAVTLLLQVCAAMSEAHAAGIIHRDLKPANLFVSNPMTGKPHVKVLDFGLAKVRVSDGAQTASNVVFGTPSHMSPEQLRSSAQVDARTDIWAMGVILYQLLTAAVPFDGPDMTSIVRKILTEPAPPVESLRPDVPRRLAEIVAWCLEKSSENRPLDMPTLARELAPFETRESTPEVRAPAASSPEVPSPVPSPVERERRWGRPEWMVSSVGAVVMLGLGLTTAALTTRAARASGATAPSDGATPTEVPATATASAAPVTSERAPAAVTSGATTETPSGVALAPSPSPSISGSASPPRTSPSGTGRPRGPGKGHPLDGRR